MIPMKNTVVAIIYFFLIGIIPGMSQDILSKPMPFYSDLASNEIWDIYQDEWGYLWIGTSNGLARYDGHQVRSFKNDYRFPHLLTDNRITSFAESIDYLWIGTHKGINLFEKHTGKVIPIPEKSLQDKDIAFMLTTKKGEIWIASGGNLYRCRKDGSLVRKYDMRHILKIDSQQAIILNSLYEDKSGVLWVLMGKGGLCRYDSKLDTFSYYPYMIDVDYYTMYQDKAGGYWIGTWGNGLWKFQPDSPEKAYFVNCSFLMGKDGKESAVYSIVQDDVYHYLWFLSYNKLYALDISHGDIKLVDIDSRVDTQKMYTRILKDREGNLWLSSYDLANVVRFDKSGIKYYSLSQVKNDLGWDTNILHLCVDENNVAWVNQDRLGLCLYELDTDKLHYADLNGKVREVNLMVKAQQPLSVWVNGRGDSRLVKIIRNGSKLYVTKEIDLSLYTDNCGDILQMMEDSNLNLWVLSSNNLFVISPNDYSAVFCEPLNKRNITHLCVDTHREIWGISTSNQVFSLRYSDKKIVATRKVICFTSEQEDTPKLSCVDYDDCMWIVSSLGYVYRSTPAKDKFELIGLNEILNDCIVLKLLVDRRNLWVITNKKILKYNLQTKLYTEYSTRDSNMRVHLFRGQAACPDNSGGIYAGGHNGFIHLLQSGSQWGADCSFAPMVTDIKVDGSSVFFDKPKIGNTVSHVFLTSRDRNIELSFSTLEYGLQREKQIAFKLEGVDKDWVYPEVNKFTAFYNELPKGTFHFRLKYIDNGKWVDSQYDLTIVRLPAWYETWWAYTFYIVLGITVLCLVEYFYLRRLKKKNQIKLKEELAKTKIDYFTNVSHEILTPLTVILTVIEFFEKNTFHDQYGKQVNILKRNVLKVRHLIQQALDFRKINTQTMPLHISYGRIDSYIKNVCVASFMALSSKKHQQFNVVTNSSIEGYVDFEKLDQILYNLLSNAIKYTPEGKRVELQVSEKMESDRHFLIIKVSDQGIGIKPKDLKLIFNQFYTGKNATGNESNGIGLYLTKSLVELHHGEISVESVYGEGSVFTVSLPLNKEVYATIEETTTLSGDNKQIMDASDIVSVVENEGTVVEKSTVLFIDDDKELLYVLQQTFLGKYNVLVAETAKCALEQLSHNDIDMIVCDITLPDMIGWDLCKKIKTDYRYMHIPIIILTAKQGVEDQVVSYNVGTDGFLTKPFEIKVLEARIDNLILTYKRLQSTFRKEQSMDFSILPYQAADKKLLEKITSTVREHLEEAEFDLEMLSKELGMSKSTLHRKIKAMTGLTPLDFIRNIKMKEACVMLNARQLSISEIAYALGFTNPKYFTKCFKDEFGVTPTEFQQKSIIKMSREV